MAEPISPSDITIDEAKRNKPIELLYEAMMFWHEEGQRLIKELQSKLNSNGNGKDAVAIALKWKGVDDRWIDIAHKLAPYTAPKLSSMEVKQNITKRYVIEVPSLAPDKKQWVQRVEAEAAMLPKYVPDTQPKNEHDETIDEIEFENINEAYR